MRIFLASGHVREEPLELHALGDLPAPSAVAVERHMKSCRSCKQRSARIAELIRSLRLLAVQSRTCTIRHLPEAAEHAWNLNLRFARAAANSD